MDPATGAGAGGRAEARSDSGAGGRADARSDSGAGGRAEARSDATSAEAGRLEARLAVARDRLDALLPPPSPQLPPRPQPPQWPPQWPPRGAAPPGATPSVAAPRGGVARIAEATGDGDDDELRELLRPAAARVARLVELAGSLAAGSLTDESAAAAARTIADEQPFRRPR